MVLEPVAKMTIYMPVLEATLGWTPKLRSSGFRIELPPKPRAPDAQPPTKENIINFSKLVESSSTSDSIALSPKLILRFYSFFICLIL
jgi:hypothetical protein